MMRSDAGTYVLVLHCTDSQSVQVGRWGELKIQPGYYLYVGSAFGPGGVKARVSRHARADKMKHWHLDYLRDHLQPLEAWCSYDDRRLEHDWAEQLQATDGLTTIAGFGCTDCNCESHLFWSEIAPDYGSVTQAVDGTIEQYSLNE